MRIAFVITRGDGFGGAQVHVRDLAEALLHAGHDVKVFVDGCAGPAATETEALANSGVPHHCLKHLVHPLRPHRDAAAFFELRRELKAFAPDLVSNHSSKAGLLGGAAARSLGIPAIVTSQGFTFAEGVRRKGRKLYTLIEWIGAKLAARIITVSAYDRSLALKRGVTVPEKVRTIHDAVPDVDAGLRADPSRQPPRVVMVARFEPPQDHATLLRALARLKHLPWTLDLVGDGSLMRPARTLAAELGVTYRVEFAGDTRNVAERLARAQVFALVTDSEGLPRSIVEATRAGLPVVATNVGGVREAVSDEASGFLVGRGDDTTLQDRLELLLNDAGLRRHLGDAGRRLYEEHFTFDRVLRETTAVYDEVLGPGRGGAAVEGVETRLAA